MPQKVKSRKMYLPSFETVKELSQNNKTSPVLVLTGGAGGDSLN